MYTRPGELQRVCEEVERLVWPIDRAFAERHPRRKHWIRPAEDIEIAEEELGANGEVSQHPPGTRLYVLVTQFAPGIRTRKIFYAPDIGDGWRTLSEKRCRQWYRALRRRYPFLDKHHGEMERCVRQLAKKGVINVTP